MYFDIIIALMVVILAVKGIFTGLIRETCSAVGIIGGVVIASRHNVELGAALNELLKLQSQTLINLIGFVTILAAVWVISLIIAEILVRFARFIRLGIFDKIFGAVMAGVKIFLVISIIFFTFSKINILSSYTQKLHDSSAVYPVMIKIGDIIVKTDFVAEARSGIQTQVNSGLEELVRQTQDSAQNAGDSAKDSVESSVDSVLDSAKNLIKAQ